MFWDQEWFHTIFNLVAWKAPKCIFRDNTNGAVGCSQLPPKPPSLLKLKALRNAKVLSRCGCLHFGEFSRCLGYLHIRPFFFFECLIKGNNVLLVACNSPQFLILACTGPLRQDPVAASPSWKEWEYPLSARYMKCNCISQCNTISFHIFLFFTESFFLP